MALLILQAGTVGYEKPRRGGAAAGWPCGRVQERQGLLTRDKLHMHGHYRYVACLQEVSQVSALTSPPRITKICSAE